MSESGADGPRTRDAAAPDGDVPLDVDPDAEGPAAFVQALRVPRNAAVGAAVGVGFTALVFLVFVVLPGTTRSPLWYVGLGFVLALSVAGLVAFVLTLARAVRLSRTL
jgi:tetrahydromethanopterin S-methyltransferase subunit B